MPSNSENDEDELTSLLASSSAPPGGSRPRSSLLDHYEPTRPPQQQQFLSTSRPSLTEKSLEEMERVAARLAGDNIGDSDSVNGLLAGMDGSDDEASASGVTTKDLERLACGAGEARDGEGAGKRPSVPPGKMVMMVDKIGDELLEARGDPAIEQRILRQSLKLGAPPTDRPTPADGELSSSVRKSTRALRASVAAGGMRRSVSVGGGPNQGPGRPPSKWVEIEPPDKSDEGGRPTLTMQLIGMVALMVFVMAFLAAAVALGTVAVGPPRQPVGEYRIVEAQVGEDFWQYYNFYAGKDSAGSNGYITYVSREKALRKGIIEVVTEEVPRERMIKVYEEGDPRYVEDWLAEDLAFLDYLKRKDIEEEKAQDDEMTMGDDEENDEEDGSGNFHDTDMASKEKEEVPVEQKARANKKAMEGDHSLQYASNNGSPYDRYPPPRLEPFNADMPSPNSTGTNPTETFVIISTSPTKEGPRDSVRLEGRRRFNRGLFIIDLRHMPAGCGTWPAFWLTDEANWPVNGEIDIVEGVSYQDTAKTALHSTRECRMDDVPEGSKTGSWDTAVGIPDKKTGIPDMTFRWAQDCFVYDPHQWLNQGCVATDVKLEGRSLGMPLNANGGGVYALEWDPVNRHIRTWVFSPHGSVPRNLREALRTATEDDLERRVAPDTNQWGLPYGLFPIGDGTNCPADHFRNMRLVINLAFCGSVAGNRYFMDCPKQFKEYKTCNEWVKSEPKELEEAYWKIRGVYVFEREWMKAWT